MPWSNPFSLQNFVKFNVDSYKDFVKSEQAPRVIREQRTGNQPIQEEKTGYKSLFRFNAPRQIETQIINEEVQEDEEVKQHE